MWNDFVLFSRVFSLSSRTCSSSEQSLSVDDRILLNSTHMNSLNMVLDGDELLELPYIGERLKKSSAAAPSARGMCALVLSWTPGPTLFIGMLFPFLEGTVGFGCYVVRS